MYAIKNRKIQKYAVSTYLSKNNKIFKNIQNKTLYYRSIKYNSNLLAVAYLDTFLLFRKIMQILTKLGPIN